MTQRLPAACILRVAFDGLTWGDLRRVVALAGHYHDDDDVNLYEDPDGTIGYAGIEIVPRIPAAASTPIMPRQEWES